MKNLKIGHKLVMGFMTLIIVMLLVGGYGLWNIVRVNRTHVATISHPVQRQTYLLQIEPYMRDVTWLEGIIGGMVKDLNETYNEYILIGNMSHTIVL